MNKTKKQIEKLTLGAIFTAIVIVLQTLGTVFAFFGPFAAAVALIPIVIGACLCGPAIGAWLGFVFGVVVLITGNAAVFLAVDIPGTIVIVLAKGALCGFVSGLVFQVLSRIHIFFAAFCAAVICPLVNTATFLLGCYVFLMDNADLLAENLGLTVSGMALFWALAMGNFIVEIVTTAVLSPVFVRIIALVKKKKV